MALPGERVGENLRDQLQLRHQRVRPVALRLQGVEAQSAEGLPAPQRERQAQNRLDAMQAAEFAVDCGLRRYVPKRRNGNRAAHQHLFLTPGDLLLAHRLRRAQFVAGAVDVGGTDDCRRHKRPLP